MGILLCCRNLGGAGNHFVNFKLAGGKSNRDAMDARVRLRAGGVPQIREIAGGEEVIFRRVIFEHILD
jgi:hypothetical protein